MPRSCSLWRPILGKEGTRCQVQSRDHAQGAKVKLRNAHQSSRKRRPRATPAKVHREGASRSVSLRLRHSSKRAPLSLASIVTTQGIRAEVWLSLSVASARFDTRRSSERLTRLEGASSPRAVAGITTGTPWLVACSGAEAKRLASTQGDVEVDRGSALLPPDDEDGDTFRRPDGQRRRVIDQVLVPGDAVARVPG